MSDEALKKRIQRARRAFSDLILKQAGYHVSLSKGVLEARRKSEIRRIMVFLSRRDIPKSLPPDIETWLKVGRSKFIEICQYPNPPA